MAAPPELPPGLGREVQPEDCRPRFDQVLAQLFPTWSRRRLKALLREGRIKLNDRIARPRSTAKPGDRIEIIAHKIHAADSPPARPQVLHESSNFLYVYKPSGQHSIALDPGPSEALAYALQYHFPACAQASSDPRDAGAIHRLDQRTSGIVAVAKHPQAYGQGRAAMGQGGPLKQYLAVVTPLPRTFPPLARLSCNAHKPDPVAEGIELSTWGPHWARVDNTECYEIMAPLGRGGSADRVGVDEQGRMCRSEMQVLAETRNPELRRLLLLTLHTGMRHQLRVHLAMLGLPILNDPLYGPQPEPMHRLALHAWRLDLGEIDKGCGPIEAPPGVDYRNAANTGSLGS